MKKTQSKILHHRKLSIQSETLTVLTFVQLGNVTGNGSGGNCVTQSKEPNGCVPG